MGGVIPSLKDVQEKSSLYSKFSFLWELSAPRWAIEAFTVDELLARPYDELVGSDVYENLKYDRNGFSTAVISALSIGLIWQVLALATMKLTFRDRQR
jgi:hypothetical protein